jgi:SAM-dependent methyltransferase
VDALQIRDWFHAPRKSQLSRERVIELYFTFHPRTAFLKNLPRSASVVDIGAGDGSLSVFASWPEPKRTDLSLHAYSIEKGKSFDKFDSYELSDWNLAPPEFQGRKFDAIVCAHFIEHIADPVSFVDWAARKLNPGGRVYLEWPSPASLTLPPRSELEALGVPLMISRFDDPPRAARRRCDQRRLQRARLRDRMPRHRAPAVARGRDAGALPRRCRRLPAPGGVLVAHRLVAVPGAAARRLSAHPIHPLCTESSTCPRPHRC